MPALGREPRTPDARRQRPRLGVGGRPPPSSASPDVAIQGTSPTSIVSTDGLPVPVHRNGEPHDIHTKLDPLLSAFSIFPPKPKHDFDLFHIHYIHGDTMPRYKSPEVTPASFHTICTNMKENHDLFDIKPDLNTKALKMMLHLMNNKTEDKTEDDPDSANKGCSFATESSIETSMTAGAGANVTNLFDANFSYSNSKSATRAFRVSVTRWQKYIGGTALSRLIWKHGEVVFTKILEELATNIDTEIDQRRLLAIVTKKIIADVHISRQRSNSNTVDVHAAGPDGTGGTNVTIDRSLLQEDATHCEGGIAGVQYLVFPMKRLGEYKYRFLPGVVVLKPEADVNGKNADQFSVYKRWQEGENHPYDDANSDHHHHGSYNNYSCTASCLADCLQRARSAPTPEVNGLPLADEFRHTGSQDDSSTPLYTDVAPRLNRIPFIDIDLAPKLNDFSMGQFVLAISYRRKAEEEEDEGRRQQNRARCVGLLRSVLRWCCYEPAMRALLELADCYASGIGIQSDEHTAATLRYCVTVLRQTDESRRIWPQMQKQRSGLLREPEPEKIIIQTLGSISGPRRRIRLCLAVDTVCVAGRLMHFCASQGYWFMLLPEKLSFSIEPESEKSVIHLLTESGTPLRPWLTYIRIHPAGNCVKAVVTATSDVTLRSTLRSLDPTALSQQPRMYGDAGPSDDVAPSRMAAGDDHWPASYGGMLGEVMLKYLVRKFLRFSRSRNSKKKQGNTGMQLIDSAVDVFGKRFWLAEKNNKWFFRGVTSGKKPPPFGQSRIPGTGRRRSKFTVLCTLPERSSPKFSLLRELEDEDALAPSNGRDFFDTALACDIDYFDEQESTKVSSSNQSPPRYHRLEKGGPCSEPSVKNEGIPDYVDTREVHSVSMPPIAEGSITPYMALPISIYETMVAAFRR